MKLLWMNVLIKKYCKMLALRSFKIGALTLLSDFARSAFCRVEETHWLANIRKDQTICSSRSSIKGFHMPGYFVATSLRAAVRASSSYTGMAPYCNHASDLLRLDMMTQEIR